jgi:hypothetical protein
MWRQPTAMIVSGNAHECWATIFQCVRPTIGILSVAGVVLGAAIAYKACRYPRYQQGLETLSGVLLIVGFSLLGYSLEVIFGPPS